MKQHSVTMKDSQKSGEDYFRWRVKRSAQIVSFAKRYTSLNGKSILDIGCGEGPLSYILNKEGAKVCAMDIDEKRLDAMKHYTKGMNIDIKKAFNENLPYDDNSFDIMFSFDVIEHVQDYSKSFSEMDRCLRKGGLIFLEMAPYYSLISGHHLYTYTFLPAQYLPRSFMKWWVLRKKPKAEPPEERWKAFITLNKITIAKLRKLAKRHNLRIVKENYIFKCPDLFEIKINWIKNFGVLKEIIPMSYQAVLVKR